MNRIWKSRTQQRTAWIITTLKYNPHLAGKTVVILAKTQEEAERWEDIAAKESFLCDVIVKVSDRKVKGRNADLIEIDGGIT